MKSINLKLSFLVGAIAFFVAFLVGHYSDNVSTSQLKQKAGEHLITISKNINDILDREMLERYREMKFAASLDVLSNEDYSIDDKRKYIQKIKDNYNHHEWIGFALPDGTVQIGTNGYLEGKNAKARPWHPAGLKGPYIGNVHDALLLAKLLPNTSGEAIYFTDVAFPVKKDNGDVVGVLCTHLTWQWTRNIIRSIQKENGIEVFLLSDDGLILVGPDNTERMNIAEISTEISDKFLNSDEKFEVVKWNNHEYLTASSISKGIGEYKGFSWRVIVRQTPKIAFASVNKNTKDIYIISLIAGVIGLIVGIIFSSLISNPIKKLIDIVDNIKSNKEVKFIDNLSSDEIGKLQDAIEDLYLNLKTELELKADSQIKIDVALKLFEQSNEGIIVTDEHNNIILINKAFTKITGFTFDDVYGKNPKVLNSGKQDIEFYKQMWESIITKDYWEGTIENLKKDGSPYLENLKIATLKDKNGKILHYIATFSG